jgi:hypothetical protein
MSSGAATSGKGGDIDMNVGSGDTGIGGKLSFMGSSTSVSDGGIISIESGLFEKLGEWHDKAVVMVYDVKKDNEFVLFSDSVVFPTEYVDRAREIGFESVTVGEVMMEDDFVKNNKDPHLCISGISRKVFIENTVSKLVEKIELNK